MNLFKCLKALKKISFSKIHNFMKDKTQESKGQIFAFGVILTINYPVYYLIWLYGSHQSYENLILRLSASFVCLLLCFRKYWPEKIQLFFPYYWYFAATYSLPFFFTFMTLKNHASTMWLMNTVSILFFLILLFDLVTMSFLLILGIGAGILCYLWVSTNEHFVYLPGVINFNGIVATLAAAAFVGMIFSRNKEKIQNEKFRTIATIGESIAHELRTPLRTIHAGAEGLKGFLPNLIESYAAAKAAKLLIPEIDEMHYDALARTLDNIAAEVQSAFAFINMLLVNSNEAGVNVINYKPCGMQECVELALERYPFDFTERTLLNWKSSENFLFKGDEQLMSHVIFNLLKNALYYIKAANKGKIYIWMENHPEMNYLYFKDTGTGISKKVLPNIFERFFSKTYHGTGIGLAFCRLVMKSFGGEISCNSEEGMYTEFVLRFPIMR